MHHFMQIVDRKFGRPARHALGFGAVLTVAVIVGRLADERAAARQRAAYHASVARQAAVTDAMNAPTLTNFPIPGRPDRRPKWQDVATAIRNAVIVQGGEYVPTPPKPAPPADDPVKTLPLTRRELMALVEVDGGRPVHELDYLQGVCDHPDSMYGRCALCGMTWADQAQAMGGAR